MSLHAQIQSTWKEINRGSHAPVTHAVPRDAYGFMQEQNRSLAPPAPLTPEQRFWLKMSGWFGGAVVALLAFT